MSKLRNIILEYSELHGDLESLFKQSSTYKDIFASLGSLSYTGRLIKELQQVCQDLGIDPTPGMPIVPPNKIPDELIFVKDSPYVNNRINLKKRILENGWLTYQCSECRLDPVWNGKELTLQLDHVNGINNDHRIENLRFLCPNCHTQTNTYAGKSRLSKPTRSCLTCNEPFVVKYKEKKYCSSKCYHSSTKTTNN